MTGVIDKLNTLVNLSDEAADWLASNCVVINFSKNQQIQAEGKVCHYLYYIRSGMLSGYYLNDGKQICNWISIENDLATSFYSFTSRQPSYESIEALEQCEVESIHHDKLMEMYTRFPETERAGRLILEEYYARLEERLHAIQFKTAKERYDTFCNNRIEIIRRAPLGKIASLLGMTQETLSRIRAIQ